MPQKVGQLGPNCSFHLFYGRWESWWTVNTAVRTMDTEVPLRFKKLDKPILWMGKYKLITYQTYPGRWKVLVGSEEYTNM